MLDQGEAINLIEDVQWTLNEHPMRLVTRKFPLRSPRGDRVGIGSMSRDLAFEQTSTEPVSWGIDALAVLPLPVVVTDEHARVV